MSERILNNIKEMPIFEGLSRDMLIQVASVTRELKFDKGETIFFDGDSCKGFFFILEGKVKIFKLSPDGKEQILHLFGSGEPFGEVAVFYGIPYPATAETLEPTSVLFFSRQGFVKLIEKNPSIAMKMLAVLSLRLKKFTLMIEGLSLKEVPGRLASYLMVLMKESGDKTELRLDISKNQLASLLGTIPETLSRIFSKMAAQDLIEMNGPVIKVIDKERLKEVAEGFLRV